MVSSNSNYVSNFKINLLFVVWGVTQNSDLVVISLTAEVINIIQRVESTGFVCFGEL